MDRRSLFALVVALLVSLAAPIVSGAAVVSAAPRRAGDGSFAQAACMFTLPQNVVEGRDIRCGWLTVPEVHDRPSGKTIRLAVAIVKSKAPNVQPDPLVMMQGGPGGSTIDYFSQALFTPGSKAAQIVADRDIVLFDQRGTLYSEPALTCSEEWDLTERTVEQRLTFEQADKLGKQATQACHDRLASDGVNFAAYDSVENAADVESLRLALGYEKINLYGVSYGTLLALHVMRDYPQGLRSVIIDAVVPTQTNFVVQVPQTQQRAFNELFGACRADSSCNAAYPTLEQTFYDTVAKLNATPATVSLHNSKNDKQYKAVLDGDSLVGVVFQLLYASEFLPALPMIIDDASKGNFLALSLVLPQILFDRTFATAMYDSVLCAEDADYSPEDVDLTGVRPEIAKNAKASAASFLATCKIFNVPQLPKDVDDPVVSDVPTLITNGRFDPITPPTYGAEAAKTLRNNYIFTFNNTGHGAVPTGGCPTQIALAFLDDPTRAPESSCVAKTPPPAFLTPSAVGRSKLTGPILELLNARRWGTPLLIALSLLLLGTLFLVWPVAWLARLMTGGARPERTGLRTAARWAALLLALLGAVALLGPIATLLSLAIQNDVMAFLGFPAPLALAFNALPWVCAALALVMLVCAAAAWAGRRWPGWERGYYSVLTLAALAMVGGLLVWG